MDTKEMQKKEPKKPGKIMRGMQLGLGWLFLYVVTFIMILVGQFVGYFIVEGAGALLANLSPDIPGSDLWITGSLYLMFTGIWLFAMILFVIGKGRRCVLKMLGSGMSGNNLKGILIGLAVGGGANAFCILIAYLHRDIALYFDSFQLLPLLFLFAAVWIQSSAEELVCRGYLYRKLMNLYKDRFWLCAVLNSLLFAVLHLGNEGVTLLSLINIFLSGILFTLMVYYFDSMWAAFAGHTAWNYTQNIIFGLPNSGIVSPYSILKLDVSVARDSFAYNVGFGIEGTLVADVVLLACCVGIYLWGRRKIAGKM